MLKLVLRFIITVSGFFISTSVLGHGISAEYQSMVSAGPMAYLKLGAIHMLTGYDHLLFLFGVMFFLTRYKDIFILITAFTVGHSITLIFATIYQIQANYYLIDAVIALTVCYKAFENLEGFKKLLQINSPNLLLMVFIFGLIHGFGLSTRLQQLPLGEDNLIIRILAFNVGVEAGQIIALSIMLFFLTLWRKHSSFKHFELTANWGLMLAGALLMLMQLHAYEHTRNPYKFPLNEDEHHHAHEEIEHQKKSKHHNH